MSGRIVKIRYTTKPCGRCGGSGRYSYCARYGSTCFRCHGDGTKHDTNGKNAIAKVRAWKAENCARTMDALVKGDQIRETVPTLDGGTRSRWVRFDRIEEGRAIFTGKPCGEWMPAEVGKQAETFEIRPVGDLFQQMAEFAERYKGVELVREEGER